jgi:hypothetical protein
MSHQRASQIFGFLADKKRISEERPSRLPTRKVTPPLLVMLDLASSDVQPFLSDTQLPEFTHTETTSQLIFPSSQSMQVTPAANEKFPHHIVHSESEPVIINYTGQSSSSGQSSQGPRGPRALTKIPSRSKSNPSPWLQNGSSPLRDMKAEGTSSRPAFGERSNEDVRYPGFAAVASGDAASLIPPSSRPPSSQRSKAIDLNDDSRPSILARNGLPLHAFASTPSLAKGKSQVEASLSAHKPPRDKENDMTSQLPQPKTPLRPFGFRAPHLQDKPSPASSSELSPMGKQIMTNLRHQRMQARQKERQTGRLGSSHSRIRY